MATMSRIADEILSTHIEVAIAIASGATLVGLGADDPQVSRARGLLAELYDALGPPEEAAAWR